MNNDLVVEQATDYLDVAQLVKALLIELEPAEESKLDNAGLEHIAKELINSSKIWAFIAKHQNESIGVITLHECAAIYAGGIFGEISELYVKPEFRSLSVGELLLKAALEKGKSLGWKRLEVGSPPPADSPRTIQFYEREGFACTGSRLRCLIEP